MLYLIAEMIISLLLAALLGLGMGYLLWGLVANRRKEEMKSLKENVTARAVEAESLTRKVEQITAAQTKAEASNTEKESEVARLNTELNEIQSQLSQVRVQIRNKDSEIAGHLQMHAAHTTSIAEKEKALQAVRNELTALRLANEELTHSGKIAAKQSAAELSKKDEEIARLNRQVSEHLTNAAGLNAQIRDLHNQLADVRTTIQAKDTELASHVQRSSTHAKLVAEKDETIQTLRTKMAELQSAHDQAITEKNDRLLALRKRVEELEADNEKVRESQASEAAAAGAAQPPLSTAAVAGGLGGYMLQPSSNGDSAESLLSALLEPLNQADVSRMAAQMKTGSELGDWLQAERHLRLERLDSVRKNWAGLQKVAD